MDVKPKKYLGQHFLLDDSVSQRISESLFIKKNLNLGLPIDSSINIQFEKKIKHMNYIFSNGIDFIHEFFNFERKFKNNFLSSSVKLLGENPKINKLFTNIADRGINF